MTGPGPVDGLATPLAVALLAAVTAKLVQAQVPVCMAYLTHAAGHPPMDGCDCSCDVAVAGADPIAGQGTAWIKVMTISPAGQMLGGTRAAAPGRMLTPPRGCNHNRWTVSTHIGIYRCAPTGVGNGEPPTTAERTASAMRALDDAALMRCAIADAPVLVGRTFAIGQWLPLGPAGGCQGGYMSVNVDLAECRCGDTRRGTIGT